MAMYPQPDEPDETSADTPSDNGAGGEDEKMAGETALLPKSILGGKEFQPGQEVMLKIVAMHDDQVEVEYAPEKPDENENPGAGPGDQMKTSMASLGA